MVFKKANLKWLLIDDEKPAVFKLVMIKDAGGREQQAWWTGTAWDYGSKIVREKIVAWKDLNQGDRVKACRVSKDPRSY